MTLTKAELTDTLIAEIGLTHREAKAMVEAFFDEIAVCLTTGEAVKLAGFGTFETLDKVARPGRNPKTGEAIPVSARRVVTFHPSRTFRTTVDQNLPDPVRIAA